MPFTSDQLELLDSTDMVHIETQSGSRSYRTIIWVVVSEEDVFVRSVRGESGKWYQRALDHPEVVVQAGTERLPARAVPATDPTSVERTSDALRGKYRAGGSLDSMLRPDVLETTLRLDPI